MSNVTPTARVSVSQRRRTHPHPALLSVEVLTPSDPLQWARKPSRGIFGMGAIVVWIFEHATRIGHACTASVRNERRRSSLRVAGASHRTSLTSTPRAEN